MCVERTQRGPCRQLREPIDQPRVETAPNPRTLGRSKVDIAAGGNSQKRPGRMWLPRPTDSGALPSREPQSTAFDYPGVPNPLTDDHIAGKHLTNSTSADTQFDRCIRNPHQTHDPYSTATGTNTQHLLGISDQRRPMGCRRSSYAGRPDTLIAITRPRQGLGSWWVLPSFDADVDIVHVLPLRVPRAEP